MNENIIKPVYGYIYCLTLKKDNRKYFGQTTQDPYQYYRREYVCSLGGNRTHLNRAIKKYGIDSFDFAVICKAYSKKRLDIMERYYIKKYKCRDKRCGFNLMEGGSHGKHNEETKRKWSISRKGKQAGISHPNALITTIRNIKTNEIVSGCMKVLAKQYYFNYKHMSARGKSKDWRMVRLTTKDGIDVTMPSIPRDKELCKGLSIKNAKLATIRNIATGEQESGCVSELARKYHLCRSEMSLKSGRSGNWVLVGSHSDKYLKSKNI